MDYFYSNNKYICIPFIMPHLDAALLASYTKVLKTFITLHNNGNCRDLQLIL